MQQSQRCIHRDCRTCTKKQQKTVSAALSEPMGEPFTVSLGWFSQSYPVLESASSGQTQPTVLMIRWKTESSITPVITLHVVNGPVMSVSTSNIHTHCTVFQDRFQAKYL
jgi:hypothetical protein